MVLYALHKNETAYSFNHATAKQKTKINTGNRKMKTLTALNAILKDKHSVHSLITTSNPKVEKNAKALGIAGACLHLDPVFAVWVCSFAGLCKKLCLNKAGNPSHKVGKALARYSRTALVDNDEQLFLFALAIGIARYYRKAKKSGFKTVSFRPNATSDLLFETMFLTITPSMKPLLNRYGVRCRVGKQYTIFQLFPSIVFYDYSKVPVRFERELPKNYSLAFSLDGANNVDCAIEVLNAGGNVAIPFYSVPSEFTLIDSNGKAFTYPVYNGDNSDYRPSDPKAHIVGLKYKRVSNGESNENNGFIIERIAQSIAQQSKAQSIAVAK
jgi:hypothetical protein